MDSAELNLSTIAREYSDEEAAWLFFEETRWPNGPICPHCGTVGSAYYLEPKAGSRKTRTGKVTYRRLWKCAECREQFSVLVGTIFEDTKMSLSKWLLAVHMMNAGKNGVSALEISRVLGIAYSSAWFMMHRIRKAMERTDGGDKLSAVVEADETYIGGRAHGKRGRGALNKTPVVTLVQRDGEARSQVVANVTGANVKDVLLKQAEPSETVLVTDNYHVYEKPGQEFAEHHTVDHGKKEYARTDDDLRVHTTLFCHLGMALRRLAASRTGNASKTHSCGRRRPHGQRPEFLGLIPNMTEEGRTRQRATSPN